MLDFLQQSTAKFVLMTNSEQQPPVNNDQLEPYPTKKLTNVIGGPLNTDQLCNKNEFLGVTGLTVSLSSM